MKRIARAQRLAAGLAAALVASAASAVLVCRPAEAAESYPVPPSGVLTFEGRGWGHGRGMSQWGAQGAALAGLDHPQILGFYYPGSALTTRAARDVRVRLTAEDADLQVQPEPGVTATDTATGARLDVSTLGAARVRAVAVGDGTLALQQADAAGTWTAVSSPAWPASAVRGPIEFGAATPLWAYTPAGERRYRGVLVAVPSGAGLVVVDRLSLEDYLRGVVPREALSSWQPAALRAQAVAARSYAAFPCHATADYDLLDTTTCQVYGGMASRSGGLVTPLETASTDAAVQGTAGVEVTLGGATQRTEFSSSNGGWTVASSPWPARADPYDAAPGNTRHRWTGIRVAASTLAAAYPAIGGMTRLDILTRDGNGEWGGRVLTARLVGTAGSVTLTGEQLRTAGGLSSSWLHPTTWYAASTGLAGVDLATTGSTVRLLGASTSGTATGPSFGLPLPETAGDWRWYLSREADLVGIKVRNTGSGRVEVHTLSATSDYTQWIMHAATPVPADAPGLWAVGSFDSSGRPDLWYLPTRDTGTGGVEVHVLSAASNYQGWVMHTGTALGPFSPTEVALLVGDAAGRGDLTLVLHANSGSGRTEVHRLTRSSLYRDFDLHMAIPLPYTDDATVSYGLARLDGDATPDLVVVLRGVTGTGTVEVHGLGGASLMSTWILHAGTQIPAPSGAVFAVRQP